MRTFSNKSIRFKFAAVLVAGVTFILAIFTTATIMGNIRVIETQLLQKMSDASRLAKLSLSSALWQFNHDYVSDFVESLFLYEDIVFVTVFSGKDVVKKKIRADIFGMDFIDLRASPDYISRESTIEHASQTIGKIQIVLTRERERKVILYNTIVAVLFLFIIVAAILITNLLITRFFLFNPIKKLERSASKIAQGDLDTPIDISATDEIGELAKVFNHMIQNIKEVTASRDELNDEIHRRLSSEQALRQERDRAQNYLDIAGVIIIAIDMNQNVMLINKKGCEVLGLPEEKILGCNWFETFLPVAIQGTVKETFNQIINSKINPVEYYENEIVSCSGKTHLIAWHNTMLKDKMGKVLGTLSSGEDITERKKSEVQLVSSLKEKEILLKEIHHRVKNNMQMIQSLFNLQADKIKEDELKIPFIESNSRIKVMALVHENLYQSDSLSKINLNRYFSDLTGQILHAYGTPEKEIDLALDVEPMNFDIDKIIACGLIVNELMTNSMKYAFVDKQEGKITLTLRQIGSESVELIISDNGSGLPMGFDVEQAESLGLRLVQILVESQLDATLKVDQKEGLTYAIQFSY